VARVPPVVEVALAFVAAIATFALAGVALSGIDSTVVVVLLGVVYVVAVIAIARVLSIAYAVPVAMAGLLAYDWFYLPPTHALEFPDSANLVDLLAFVGVAILLGQLAAHATRRAEASERARGAIADEQAALRRVATLVARGVPPPEVFAAVAREVGQLLGVDSAHMGRYDPDRTATGVGSWSPGQTHLPVGTSRALDDTSVMGMVLRSGRPARVEGYDDASAEIAALTQELSIRSSVGAPIVVAGQLWGVMVASSGRDHPLPEDTESRLLNFTGLAATAVSNAQARAEVRRLADEQAALRRVATLVASESPPAEVFAQVAEEVGLLMRAENAWMHSYSPAGTTTVVATWGELENSYPVGARLRLEGENVSALVRATGQPARLDDYANVTGSPGTNSSEWGIRSAVGTPIVVEGQLWGAMIAASRRPEPLPADAEARIEEFTKLVATAIANIQARSDLAASRARIVAAADDERRRVVRDLHDGAQQRLVHTVVTLKLAQRALENGAEAPAALIGEALDEAERATAELRELAHGILPSVLTRGGLRAGLEALASRMAVPVEISVSEDRLPAAVEATAYFVVAEALTNVAKHSRAARAEVVARVEDGHLRLQVRDDGVGGVRLDGSGLLGLADRLEVLNGRLQVESPRGGGTLLAAAIPLSD
jgi:signal transduction histidine kinase